MLISAPEDLSPKLQVPDAAARDALSSFLDEYCVNDIFYIDFLNVHAIVCDSCDVLMVGGMPFIPIFLTESWDWHASDPISPQRILCGALFQLLVTGVYEDTDGELYRSTHFACLALFNDKSKPIDPKMYDVDSTVEVVNREVFSHIPQAWRDILQWILPRPSIHHCESTVDIFTVKKSSAGTYAKSGIGEYGGRCEIAGVVFMYTLLH